MKIAIPKERRASERRVAASVDAIKKYKALGAQVVVETGAGDGASIPDKALADAGAEIALDAASTVSSLQHGSGSMGPDDRLLGRQLGEEHF